IPANQRPDGAGVGHVDDVDRSAGNVGGDRSLVEDAAEAAVESAVLAVDEDAGANGDGAGDAAVIQSGTGARSAEADDAAASEDLRPGPGERQGIAETIGAAGEIQGGVAECQAVHGDQRGSSVEERGG